MFFCIMIYTTTKYYLFIYFYLISFRLHFINIIHRIFFFNKNNIFLHYNINKPNKRRLLIIFRILNNLFLLFGTFWLHILDAHVNI